jgi:hypothetical protein
MAGIKGDTLDIGAKAKEGPSGTFLPLAQYSEFASLASNRAAKVEADARSKKTKDIYNKLDRADQRRKRWRWLKNLVGNVKSLIVFALYLAVVAVVCGAGWWAFTHMDFIREKLSGGH